MRKKHSSRKERVYFDYLKVKEQLGRRPSYEEVHKHGASNSKEYKQAFGGYFSFLDEYGELTDHEVNVYQKHYRWLNKVESEKMTKSYKMVVLQFLLNKGPFDWLNPITPEETSHYFHQFFMEKAYRRKKDFSNKNTKKLWNYDETKVAKLIAEMPMSKWVGKDDLVYFSENKFGMNFEVGESERIVLHEMTGGICKYKMQVYFERKSNKIPNT